MFKGIILIYIIIIIFKVFFTSIIRRINVNDINLSLMGITKGGKSFKIIPLY